MHPKRAAVGPEQITSAWRPNGTQPRNHAAASPDQTTQARRPNGGHIRNAQMQTLSNKRLAERRTRGRPREGRHCPFRQGGLVGHDNAEPSRALPPDVSRAPQCRRLQPTVRLGTHCPINTPPTSIGPIAWRLPYDLLRNFHSATAERDGPHHWGNDARVRARKHARTRARSDAVGHCRWRFATRAKWAILAPSHTRSGAEYDHSTGSIAKNC